ncbi:tail fiber assembly protein [Burkholderia thailandensis]|uniref:tail fiber assembly protein n=1 Tax=Burkholderia thailandensis TaxID=57975 RepID=UPI0003ECB2C7|nr:tail assembly chaperone [Burkholderia thailandensis]AHI66120.1 caudovirales tail fiber assembly family protein [Burkholderia thailandensis H0587]AOJ51530.1 tail fiber assembly protein [Burkholderia thailandensis]AVR23867.1 tail assembly chaperone [Burkholderia thailandensis]
MAQKFAAHDSKNLITAFYDSVDSPVPAGATCIEITDEQWKMLLDGESRGKRMAINDSGAPVLLDPPPPTVEQIVMSNTAMRDRLLERASVALAPLQTAIMLNDATDSEARQARAWIAYTRAVKGIDLTRHEPTWPEQPEIAGERNASTRR